MKKQIKKPTRNASFFVTQSTTVSSILYALNFRLLEDRPIMRLVVRGRDSVYFILHTGAEHEDFGHLNADDVQRVINDDDAMIEKYNRLKPGLVSIIKHMETAFEGRQQALNAIKPKEKNGLGLVKTYTQFHHNGWDVKIPVDCSDEFKAKLRRVMAEL